MRTRRVAILGTAPSIQLTPFDDDTLEIWGISQVRTFPDLARVDRLLEIHKRSYWSQPEVLTFLNGANVPVYMQDHYDEVPNSVAYPVNDVLQLPNGLTAKRNFTSSIAYLLALAISERVSEIRIYGVHMNASEEYAQQRAACSYWLAVADCLGIKYFVAADGADIVQPAYQYGFEERSELVGVFKERLEKLIGGKDLLENEFKAKERQLLQQMGAEQEARYWLQRLSM